MLDLGGKMYYLCIMKTLDIHEIATTTSNYFALEMVKKYNLQDVQIDIFDDFDLDNDVVRFTFDGCNNGKNNLMYHMDFERISDNYDTLIDEDWFDDELTLEEYALTEIANFVIGQLTGDSFYDQDCFDWWLGQPTKI